MKKLFFTLLAALAVVAGCSSSPDTVGTNLGTAVTAHPEPKQAASIKPAGASLPSGFSFILDSGFEVIHNGGNGGEVTSWLSLYPTDGLDFVPATTSGGIVWNAADSTFNNKPTVGFDAYLQPNYMYSNTISSYQSAVTLIVVGKESAPVPTAGGIPVFTVWPFYSTATTGEADAGTAYALLAGMGTYFGPGADAAAPPVGAADGLDGTDFIGITLQQSLQDTPSIVVITAQSNDQVAVQVNGGPQFVRDIGPMSIGVPGGIVGSFNYAPYDNISGYLTGTIAVVMEYNTVLTASQIQAVDAVFSNEYQIPVSD